MSRFSLAVGRATLADRVFGRGLGIDLVLIAAGAALTAICAQVTIPVGPIPITGQTIAVLFVGMFLGSLRGALSMLVYTTAGLVGLPIFSDGGSGAERLFGPTGGYIFGYIAAAAMVGWFAQRGLDRTFLRGLASAIVGTSLVYLVALPWLVAWSGLSVQQALAIGLIPFLFGALVKSVLVSAANAACWASVARTDRHESRIERTSF